MNEGKNLNEVDGQAGEDEKEAERDNGEGCRDRHGASTPSELEKDQSGRNARFHTERERERVSYDFKAMKPLSAPFNAAEWLFLRGDGADG